MKEVSGTQALRLESLSPGNWSSFEFVMGEKGGCGGCWCMLYRLSTSAYEAGKYEGNRTLMKNLVEEGKPTGFIAFQSGEPVGWIAMAPREDYPRIEQNRNFKRIDKRRVWSITCTYIRKEYRRQGLAEKMVGELIRSARKKGIRVLEAYPVIPYASKATPAFLWPGPLAVYIRNGFKIVQQKTRSRAMVRKELK